MDDPQDGEAVLRLVVLDAVPAHEEHARLPHLVQSAPEDLPEDCFVQSAHGEADDVQGRQGAPAHGVDVAQGVRCGDLPEGVWIVDDGREEVHRLDDRQVLPELIHPRVLAVFHAHNQARMGGER
jgi:hypothetical protein